MQSSNSAMEPPQPPRVKQELIEDSSNDEIAARNRFRQPFPVIDTIILDSSDDENDTIRFSSETPATKNQKLVVNGGSNLVDLPSEFHDPIPALPDSSLLLPVTTTTSPVTSSVQSCKQFWKAGDYEGAPSGNWESYTGGMDHVRVHPKFLHSNATSHKWALGAFAELLDNALDEVCNGATYVNIDMLINKKDGNKMLLIEDNGGGMNPDNMRQCMSLGYSAKSKIANTIGQYGNGFKTSTMRLGADVIVFTRSCGEDGKSITQSIGLLSYTFLRSTGKEDIVVPILDYRRKEKGWTEIMRSSADDWQKNLDTIITWSPYSSETELLQQFNLMKDHGTRIVIYNLWEDDQGQLELDFDSDVHDIQIRGVNRDEKNIQMAKQYPNSRHFLTYRHSLRGAVKRSEQEKAFETSLEAAGTCVQRILAPNFRIILRGKDVEHHNVVNDMMLTEEVTYRPQPGPDGVPRDANMIAIVTVGFVKDAKAHIDVQGFNVYHKNRLIKPFWRVWNAAGSDGRGVIGVLEANFVEPAHDKQGFERTTVLARLENKLVQMQKQYWSNHCHKIGYAARRKKQIESGDRESSPDYTPSLSRAKMRGKTMDYSKFYSPSSHKQGEKTAGDSSPDYTPSPRGKKRGNTMDYGKSYSPSSRMQGEKTAGKYVSVNEKYGNGNGHAYHARGGRESPEEPSSPSAEDASDDEQNNRTRKRVTRPSHPTSKIPAKDRCETVHPSRKASSAMQQETSIDADVDSTTSSSLQVVNQLKEENRQLKERLDRREEEILGELLRDLQYEKDKCKSLEMKLKEAERKIEELNREQESLIDIFSEERDRRDIEEENLRKRLRDASNTIEDLHEKVRVLDKMKSPNGRR